MIAPYGTCDIEFSLNSINNSQNEWVVEVIKHTLVNEIICIEDIHGREGATMKDKVNALLDFCVNNPNAVILLMCGAMKKYRFDSNGNLITEGGSKAKEYDSLARMKATYEMLGFQDVSLWIDYEGTGVFLYRNDRYADFMERLSAFQAGSWLSTLIGSESTAIEIIQHELSNALKARTILRSVLDDMDSASSVQKMGVFNGSE